MKNISLFSLTVTTIINLSFVIFADQANPLVQDTYPGAQIWFNQMIQKYPQAHLNQVKFCVSDNYESGPGAIYFPKSCLEAMHQTFFGKNPAEITQAMWDNFLEDEYLLLHESAHVINKDNEKGSVVLAATALAFVAFNTSIFVAMVDGKIKPATSLVAFTTGNAALLATLYGYIRFQERRADNFANEHAKPAALLAGIKWFVAEHIDQHGLDVHKLNARSTTIVDTWADPGHPSPISRANTTLQKINQLISYSKSA